MAEIWKAKVSGPAGFEKQVAIKRVLPHLAEDAEFVEMFVQEAKLVATLEHPNIVQVFDFGEIQGTYFLAMEFVPGANLDKVEQRLAAREMKLAAPVALYIAAETCKALSAAHAHTDPKGVPVGLVHRDVSPQNILVSFSGAVKVGDFGIAKAVNLRSRTETGLVRGKSAYMSPEQARGEPLDGRSDLFSAAIVLYEMIAGRRLFEGTSVPAIMTKVAGFRGPSDEDLSFVPAPLHELFRTALAGAKESRYADAVALETAIGWHLGADGAVRARQSLGALLRELFPDEAAREVADLGGAADPAATADVPVPSPSDAVDSRKATVARPLASIADRGQRRGGTLWLALAGGGAAVALGAILLSSRPRGDATPEPIATTTELTAVLPTNATTADLTTAAADGSAVDAGLDFSSPTEISGAGVDARVQAVRTLLARRFLAPEDVPGVPDDLRAASLARADGRLLDALHALDDAHRRILDAPISFDAVVSRLDRARARETTVAHGAGAPTDELESGIAAAQNLISAGRYVDANRRIYELERRMDELDPGS